MKAGRLAQERLLFQIPVVTTPGGYRTVTWTDDFKVPAEVQRDTELIARFIIRYRSGITPDSHRIIWGDWIWTITNIVHDRKRTMLTIDADAVPLVPSTDLDSETTEYVDAVPIVRPPSS